jgi:Leucine-rich repeat (LRR) protein
MTNLEFLDLGANKLWLIDWSIFENLTKLKHLKLNGNLLDHLIMPSNWSSIFPEMEILDFSSQKTKIDQLN